MLGIVYKAGGIIIIKPRRAKKIKVFLVLTNLIIVYYFLGIVDIIRRWIKNFIEIYCPLNRLIRNVE
jgi:hypothetical protein